MCSSPPGQGGPKMIVKENMLHSNSVSSLTQTVNHYNHMIIPMSITVKLPSMLNPVNSLTFVYHFTNKMFSYRWDVLWVLTAFLIISV